MHQDNILQHIEHHASTGIIHDALIPYFDQDGRWRGTEIFTHYKNSIPSMESLKSSFLPASRRTHKEGSSTILRTSFCWRGNEPICLKYRGIRGSLITNGNSVIFATDLNNVGGHLISSTNNRVYFPNLKSVGGDFSFMRSINVLAPRLKKVRGNVKLIAKFPQALETIGGILGVYSDFDFDAPCLKHIGRSFVLSKTQEIRVPVLETVGGGFLVTHTAKKINAPLLKSIKGDFLAGLVSKIHTPSLEFVARDLVSNSDKYFYDPNTCVLGKRITYPGAIQEWNHRMAAKRAMKCESIYL